MQRTYLTLLLSILGISVLLVLTFLPPKEIHSEKELALLEENQNTFTTGKAIHLSTTNDPLFITLDNNITIVTTFPSSQILQGKKIQVQGTKETVKGKSQIRAQQITLLQ